MTMPMSERSSLEQPRSEQACTRSTCPARESKDGPRVPDWSVNQAAMCGQQDLRPSFWAHRRARQHVFHRDGVRGLHVEGAAFGPSEVDVLLTRRELRLSLERADTRDFFIRQQREHRVSTSVRAALWRFNRGAVVLNAEHPRRRVARGKCLDQRFVDQRVAVLDVLGGHGRHLRFAPAGCKASAASSCRTTSRSEASCAHVMATEIVAGSELSELIQEIAYGRRELKSGREVAPDGISLQIEEWC